MMSLRTIVIVLYALFTQEFLDAQCSYCLTSETVKAWSSLLDQPAPCGIDRKGRKTGVWDFSVRENVHYGNYYCIDTSRGRNNPDTGIIRARGEFRKGIPVGTWIKYMKDMPDTYIEYFFYEKGVCRKHVYHDHHNGWWMYDSLNKTRDTLITPLISSSMEYDMYSHYCGRASTFSIQDKWLLPKEECSMLRTYRRANTIMLTIHDTSGTDIPYKHIIFRGDTTIIAIYRPDGSYLEDYYLNWPKEKTPVKKMIGYPNGELIERKDD
jgi:hypothetical protein